ncbi:MAG: hypothetical protein RLP14_04460 [Owenweeksia sp.]
MIKVKAILSVALTGILIFATAGFSVSRHYCMGMLVEESFFDWDSGCSDQTQGVCHLQDAHHDKDDSLKKNCCEDENLIINGIQVLSFSKHSISGNLNPQFFTAFLYSYLRIPFSQLLDSYTFSNAPPDLLKRSGAEILVWVQRFLI